MSEGMTLAAQSPLPRTNSSDLDSQLIIYRTFDLVMESVLRRPQIHWGEEAGRPTLRNF